MAAHAPVVPARHAVTYLDGSIVASNARRDTLDDDGPLLVGAQHFIAVAAGALLTANKKLSVDARNAFTCSAGADLGRAAEKPLVADR